MMSRMLLLGSLFCLLMLSFSVRAWDAQDHEIFDLVSALESAEGKGVTFYKFLNVSKSASLNDINRAARKLSLTIHPDKHPGNKTIEAKFARLGLIVSILRDEEKRKRYNFFHDNGVPRWKGTGYMYSRWQPGIGFAISFVLGVATLMQFAAQHVTYQSEIKRIRRFQTAAKQAANRKRDKSATGTKPVERKKVKISLGNTAAMDNADGVESDIPVPKSRQERRRMQHMSGSSKKDGQKPAQPEWIDMVVEGDDVWIVAEDGTELLLVESAASKPALKRTFIPSLFYKLFGGVLPEGNPSVEAQNIKEKSEFEENLTEPQDEATSTGVADGPKASQTKNRKGNKSKK